MGWVNALGDAVATEETLRKIHTAVNFARDTSDRIRVVVENAAQVVLYRENSSSSTASQGWNTPNAIFMVDEREQQRVQTEQQFNQVLQRWEIT